MRPGQNISYKIENNQIKCRVKNKKSLIHAYVLVHASINVCFCRVCTVYKPVWILKSSGHDEKMFPICFSLSSLMPEEGAYVFYNVKEN